MCLVKWCDSVDIDGLRVGPVLKQIGDMVSKAMCNCHVEGCTTVIVSKVEVNSGVVPRLQGTHLFIHYHTAKHSHSVIIQAASEDVSVQIGIHRLLTS